MNSKRLYRSSGKKLSRCFVFTSSTKREIMHIHAVVVQRLQRNVQKSVLYAIALKFSLLPLSSLLKGPYKYLMTRCLCL